MDFKALSDSVVGLCNDVFGVDVTYTPFNDTPVQIKGVFDNAYLEVEGVQSLRPVLRIKLSDLNAEPGKGDTVTIDTTDYRIIESHPDGYGGTTLVLKV